MQRSRGHIFGAYGVLLALIAAFWFGAIQPAISVVRDTAKAVERERDLLQRLETSLARLEIEAERLTQQDTKTPGWKAARIGEAVAIIQADISKRARAQGVVLRSVTAIDAEPIAGSQSIGLRLELEAPLDQAAAFVQQTEQVSPALLITRADLRRLNRQQDEVLQPVVFVRLEISAPVVLEGAEE